MSREGLSEEQETTTYRSAEELAQREAELLGRLKEVTAEIKKIKEKYPEAKGVWDQIRQIYKYLVGRKEFEADMDRLSELTAEQNNIVNELRSLGRENQKRIQKEIREIISGEEEPEDSN